jgi:hypothetical protein
MATKEVEVGGPRFMSSLNKSMRIYLKKQSKARSSEDVAWVIELPPSNHEAPHQTPVLPKKKNLKYTEKKKY